MQAAMDRKNPDTGKRLLAIKTAADHAALPIRDSFARIKEPLISSTTRPGLLPLLACLVVRT
jgi:hypothetical protein